VVGIVGRNGAGKSTLLKILSKITPPTSGRVEITGRVGSLLEVGTGFHDELSGRENIYLSGAILGMKAAEIRAQFDEMVAFAEIERFIDTPVKHYSTGMYLRLAFAVAAHLDPEILLVDEVLAVGDLKFQKKCLGKMESVSKQGRTVLFVSHNTSTIMRLCPRCLFLDEGQLRMYDASSKVVRAYVHEGREDTSTRRFEDPAAAPGNEVVRLRALEAINEDGSPVEKADIRKPVGLRMTYDVLQEDHVLTPNIHVINDQGIQLFVTQDLDPKWKEKPRPVGTHSGTVWIPGNYLAEGSLSVGCAINTLVPFRVHFYERELIAFQVVDYLEGDTARGDLPHEMVGVVRPYLPWENGGALGPHDSRNRESS
jgi:lipopolysaccharide transport system ATP-binding protein